MSVLPCHGGHVGFMYHRVRHCLHCCICICISLDIVHVLPSYILAVGKLCCILPSHLHVALACRICIGGYNLVTISVGTMFVLPRLHVHSSHWHLIMLQFVYHRDWHSHVLSSFAWAFALKWKATTEMDHAKQKAKRKDKLR